MYIGVFVSIRNRAFLGLQVLEIRKPFEIGAQMGNAKRSLETLPAKRLCLVIASQSLHYIEAYLLPFERNPTGPFFIDSVNRAPCLTGTARLQESLGNFSSNPWHGFGHFALLCDERIYVALSLGNFLQS